MDRSGSQTPPRYAHYGFQTDKARSQTTIDPVMEGRNRLDLSMHLPPEPSINRFDVLRRPSPPLSRYEDRRTSTYRCRSRYNRGSKEGKRRRDARRSRRKLAAVHMLDEQISQDLDRTLRSANIQPPPFQTWSIPTSVPPAASPPGPQPTRASVLPYGSSHYNFGALDLTGQSPQCTPRKREPAPPKPPTLPPQLPSWCPAMPAFLADNIKWNELPLFFDLSRLPDALEPPKPSTHCNELQVSRPKVSPKPERLSKFVPPGTSPMSKAEMLPTLCPPTHPGRVIRDAAAQTTEIIACTLDPAARVDSIIPNNGRDEQSDVHPAKLWRILRAPQGNDQNDHDEPYINSFAHELSEHESDAPYYDASYASACELDDTEIPFVHANSLTGQANERATFPLLGTEDSVVIYDTRASFPSVQELPFALNELAVDQYIEEGYAGTVLAALDLPFLPPSTCPEPTLPVLMSAANATCRSMDDGDELAGRLAHFNSEKTLFEPPPRALKSTESDTVDIVTFLKTTQPLECGCDDCDRPPALVDAEDISDEDEWMDFLALHRSRSPSLASAWEAEWGVIGDEEEQQDCARPEQCDGSIHYTPASLAHGPW